MGSIFQANNLWSFVAYSSLVYEQKKKKARREAETMHSAHTHTHIDWIDLFASVTL